MAWKTFFHGVENRRGNFPWRGNRRRAVKTRTVVVDCEGGLHLRVAAQVVKAAQHRQATVHVQCAGCPRANACSIFELLKLGAARGTPLEIVVDGPDEEAALDAVAGLFEGGGGI